MSIGLMIVLAVAAVLLVTATGLSSTWLVLRRRRLAVRRASDRLRHRRDEQ